MYSRSSSPERLKMKSRGSSPSLPSLRSVADMSGSRRQPMEDVGNIQVYSPFKQSISLSMSGIPCLFVFLFSIPLSNLFVVCT